MTTDNKKISLTVTKDVWKYLKVQALYKDTTLQSIAEEILNKAASNKKVKQTDSTSGEN